MTATIFQLKPELAEEINYFAEVEATPADRFVEKAVQTFLDQLKQEKIRRESEAFERQLPDLLQKYPDQYVAMHEGRVIASDPDLRQLHLRVFDQLKHTPVLLRQVTANPLRERVFRSPRIEREV
jgi:glutamyl-tRNA reductase